MPIPTLITPLARAANIIETGHHIRQVVCAWGHDMAVAQGVDGVQTAIADGIFAMLRERGVQVVAPDIFEPCVQPPGSEPVAELLRPSAPNLHTLSRILRVVADSRSHELQGGDQRDRTRLLSAGGPTSGKSLVAPAGLQATHYNDEHFTEILRWRLGMSSVGDPGMCRNFSASTGEHCDAALDSTGDHHVCCSYGPLRIRRHDAYADELANIVNETGAHVRREAYVRAFSTQRSEAWLDIWAFGTSQIQDLLIDVTVRHPMVSAYQPHASQTAGVAALRAEALKFERYPEKDGRSIVPFAVETWGRLGEHAENLLQMLGAEATRHARLRGHAATASSFMRRWRAALDAVLQRGVAMSLIAAREGLPGRAHCRH